MKVREALGSIGIAGLAATASAQSFTGLGIVPGSLGVQARGVSNSGAIVVGQASAAGSTIPWRWTASGGMQALNWTGYAFAVSADGHVVVGTQGLDPRVAVRWTNSGGVQPLGYLSIAHTRSDAWGVSADGSVIAGVSGVGVTDVLAFRWTQAGGMVSLGVLPGHGQSSALSISGDGSVVVGNSYAYAPGGGYPQQAFRWTQAGGLTGIGFLPGYNASAAAAVSADGATIVGGCYNAGVTGSSAFRWNTLTGMQRLDPLLGFASCFPAAVSGDGAIVVGSCTTPPLASEAFYWTAAGGVRTLHSVLTSDYGLNLSGWQLSSAAAISPDGLAITGLARNPGGTTEPFLAILGAPCYPNCDASSIQPALNISDFICFLNRFAAAEPYANCDGSTVAPILNVSDFVCFLNRFAAGCP